MAQLDDDLAKGLGPDFDEPTKDAWIACYAAVSSEMLGSQEAEPSH